MNKKMLELALYHINRTIEFIEKKNIHVMIDSRGTTTIEYRNKEGRHVVEIDKRYGCDMTGIYQTREILKAALDKLESRTIAGQNEKSE